MIPANQIFQVGQYRERPRRPLEYLGLETSQKSPLNIQRIQEKMGLYGFKTMMWSYPLNSDFQALIKLNGTWEHRFALMADQLHLIEEIQQAYPEVKFIALVTSFEDEKILASTQANLECLLLVPDQYYLPCADQLESWKQKNIPFYFYFAFKEKLSDCLLSTKQVYRYVTELESKLGADCVQSYPGLNVFDRRAPHDLEFFPVVKPIIDVNADHQEIKHTVIVPVYGQPKEIERTLTHLFQQNIRSPYQILVVDDGENERLHEFMDKMARQAPRRCRLTYLIHPRIHRRMMGDKRFRAGISRNLGCRFAVGEIVHFLDADVLVPSHFLKTVEKELENVDLLQIQRFDLTKEFTLSGLPIQETHPEKDIVYKGREYWYDFFKQGARWNELKNPWKYVCTYGLSLKKEVLDKLGGIRTNYIYYGFEDTDFGYRLWKAGGRLGLSSVEAYHQFHFDARSEFKNSNRLRRKLMNKTGQIFYLNNLNPILYQELVDYTSPRYSMGDWLAYLAFGFWKKKISQGK